ncbi:PXM16 [Symbiodinium sp. CCMP2592]|nr:PXM16 [Symbiodinium sp. CCMP2592]
MSTWPLNWLPAGATADGSPPVWGIWPEETLVDPTAHELEFDFGHGLQFRLLQRPESFASQRAGTSLSCAPTERGRRTGCMVWDGAAVLAGMLSAAERSSQEHPGREALGSWRSAARTRGILELGAGEGGLPGMLASRAFGCQAILTDLEDVVPQLAQNVALNSSTALVQALHWGKDAAVEWPGAFYPPFGLLLAADCLYDTGNVPPFVDSLCALSGPESEALVSFDTALGRWGAYSAFEALVRERWASVEELPLAWQHPRFRKHEVKIFRLAFPILPIASLAVPQSKDVSSSALLTDTAKRFVRAEESDPLPLQQKPRGDPREYQYAVLSNGLQVVNIFDPNSTQAAVSVATSVGSLSDPKDFDGLAHLTEHAMFLGSEKFPEQSGFDVWLAERGGFSNAYTAEEQTVYYVALNEEDFEACLDRYADVFLAPLFKASWIWDEVSAVDSEHSKNRNSQDWRLQELIRYHADERSPMHRFHTGSRETLQRTSKETLAAEIQAFFAANYCPPRLTKQCPRRHQHAITSKDTSDQDSDEEDTSDSPSSPACNMTRGIH